MPVEEREIRASTVEVGMNKIRRTNTRDVLGIKQPDHRGGAGNGREFRRRVIGASTIMILVKTVMKQVIAAAATRIGGANPEAASPGLAAGLVRQAISA